ncbi:hypothetical protein [Legionella yabuuchiae]|uniref:hypothetical protein n=1 Tax=Legionella yabuuchiae TaxID=376727 RepID=UPI0010548234|nr:hypothetical protein [Legionella yabuuchiae]
MNIKKLLLIPTAMSLGLACSFAFAAENSDKSAMVTLVTKDGKQIRCYVHSGDQKEAAYLKRGTTVQLGSRLPQ